MKFTFKSKALIIAVSLLVMISLGTGVASAQRRYSHADRPQTERHLRAHWTLRTVPKWLRNTTWYQNIKHTNKYNVMKFYKWGFVNSGYDGRRHFVAKSYVHPENLNSNRIPKNVFKHKTLNWFSGTNYRNHGANYFCTSGYYGAGGDSYHKADHNHKLVADISAGMYDQTFYNTKRLAHRNPETNNF